MRKKITALLMIALLTVLTLGGCKSGSSGASTGSGGKILCLCTDLSDTFLGTLFGAMKTHASSLGATVDIVETGGSVEEQANQVAAAKAAGYTAIIMRLADASTALQMNVASNDIPIIYVNSQPSDEHLTANKYIFAGSSEEQAGQYQAEYVLSKLGNPKSLNVIIFEGEPGHAGTIGRTKAVKETLKASGCTANYVFVDYANWSADTAAYKLGIFMKTGQSVDAIFCNNDNMAIGAIEGMKKYGLDYTKIPVCGVDATTDGCASIEAGEMAFTVLQDADGQALAAVQAAVALGNGGTIEGIEYAESDGKYIYVPFTPVTASNVSQYK
ncbi:substrate-binding domain-containing protein [Butyrivibrio proteoclasticus]|uniref:substrate-binding domain-containing protein n=1 Tax=Butyrivibrio proteoclasticus TaxID=43305 RepID=UPI00047E6516|nr:substrate-binding domain-containing protein [Butyrivibrio proteoclasticus]